MSAGIKLQLETSALFLLKAILLLQQILFNLITNALALHRRVAIGGSALSYPRRNQGAVEVSDTGVGIPPDELPQFSSLLSRKECPFQRTVVPVWSGDLPNAGEPTVADG